ncbi:MAG: rhomboid family intramembrane serine protease [Chthonomonadaceae bacterium]|nr:rhomboid family intramembrane serine protease [Chthonomonadaceae bacterium]
MTQDQVKTSQHVPWVTLSLIALNLIFALLSALDREFALNFAFDPQSPSLLSAGVSLFLHSNLVHLLANMVFLAAVGPKVEETTGRARFVFIYLAGGLIGVVVHLVLMRFTGSPVSLLGASGAISSCVGYCSVRFLSQRVPLAPRVSISVGAVALIWLALQGAGVFVRLSGEQGGTAFWTHVAGFVTGLSLALLFKELVQNSRQSGHDLMAEVSGRGPGAVLAAAKMHLESHPNDVSALSKVAEVYEDLGDTDHAAQYWAQVLDSGDLGSGRKAIAALDRLQALDRVAGLKRIRFAHNFQSVEPEIAKTMLYSVTKDPKCSDQWPDALLCIAQMTTGEEQARALATLEGEYSLHAATEVARAQGLLR